MSLPELRGSGQLLTDPKTGPTKSGGTWTSALLKFTAWKKVDEVWTEGDSTVGSVIAFDDAAQVLAGLSKGDGAIVQGTVSAAIWQDKPQLRVTASKVEVPERQPRGNRRDKPTDGAAPPSSRRREEGSGLARTPDSQWPKPAVPGQGKLRGAQPHAAQRGPGATITNLRDHSRRSGS